MERISALMDGELDRDEAIKFIPGVRDRDELREAWNTYHLIGDALRGQPQPTYNVAETVAAELKLEPTVLAPRRTPAESIRRFFLPSLAAAAAVATVTWMSIETQQAPVGTVVAVPVGHLVVPSVIMHQPSVLPDFAQAAFPSAPAPAATPIQLPVRQIDAYLLAHQEFSPSTTMQGLATYVRTVSAGATETGR